MAEPVTEPVRVGSEDSDGLRHERVFFEETAGCFNRFFLLAVKGGLAHFQGDPPGDLLRMPVFLSHAHRGLLNGSFDLVFYHNCS